MDKYIKMLLIKLSPKYKVVVTTIMFYDDENQKFSNIIKLKVTDKTKKKDFFTDCYGKRALISELMKWAEENR